MKKTLAAPLLFIFLLFSASVNAQTLKDLINQKKLEAKQKVNNKLDQKTSEGIDAAVNAPENEIKKVKEKKKKKNDDAPAESEQNMNGSNAAAASASSNKITVVKPNENGEFIIKTNIKCAAGKLQIENLLRESDGVSSVSIDASTGKLYLSAAGNSNVYNTAIETINSNGFEADGKKPASTKNKSCK